MKLNGKYEIPILGPLVVKSQPMNKIKIYRSQLDEIIKEVRGPKEDYEKAKQRVIRRIVKEFNEKIKCNCIFFAVGDTIYAFGRIEETNNEFKFIYGGKEFTIGYILEGYNGPITEPIENEIVRSLIYKCLKQKAVFTVKNNFFFKEEKILERNEYKVVGFWGIGLNTYFNNKEIYIAIQDDHRILLYPTLDKLLSGRGNEFLYYGSDVITTLEYQKAGGDNYAGKITEIIFKDDPNYLKILSIIKDYYEKKKPNLMQLVKEGITNKVPIILTKKGQSTTKLKFLSNILHLSPNTEQIGEFVSTHWGEEAINKVYNFFSPTADKYLDRIKKASEIVSQCINPVFLKLL